jgi:hypothetical protein
MFLRTEFGELQLEVRADIGSAIEQGFTPAPSWQLLRLAFTAALQPRRRGSQLEAVVQTKLYMCEARFRYAWSIFGWCERAPRSGKLGPATTREF